MVPSKLSEGLNDMKTQLGQWSSFYFQIFQLEEEKKTKTVSISDWVIAQIYWASSVIQNYIGSLCVYFFLQLSEFFLNVKI